MVDTAYHEVLREIFLQTDPFRPSVVAEDLAHGITVFSRFDCCGARAEITQCEMIEFTVPLTEEGFHLEILTLRQDLSADVVDTGHILPVQSAEIMSQRHTGLCMGVVVLDQMADISHAVLPTPGADLLGEILAHQFRDRVHNRISNRSCFFRRTVMPQHYHLVFPFRTKLFNKFLRQFVRKRKIGLCSHCVCSGHVETVAKFRLVREESQNGLAEIVFVMLIMRLIHGVDEDPAGFPVHHIDVFPMDPQIPAQTSDVNLISSRRFFPPDSTGIAEGDIREVSRSVHRGDGQNPVIRESRRTVRHKPRCGDGSEILRTDPRWEHFREIQNDLLFLSLECLMGRCDGLPVQFQRRILHRAVGETRRKMGIVQNPDLHITVSRLIQDDVHIGPPFWTAEIRVRTGLDAYRAATALADHLHHLPQRGLVLSVLTEEREDMVSAVSYQQFLDCIVHRILLFQKDTFIISTAIRP